MLYECTWDTDLPIAEYPLGLGPRAMQKEGAVPPSADCMEYSLSREVLITGADDGSISLRSVQNPDFFSRIQMHDGDRGHVVSVATSFDENFVLSAGADGLLVVYNLKKGQLMEEAKTRAATMARQLAEGAVPDEDYVYGKEDAAEGSADVVPGFPHAESSTKSLAEATLDPAAEQVEAPDITDPSAYSIQDAKLKVH